MRQTFFILGVLGVLGSALPSTPVNIERGEADFRGIDTRKVPDMCETWGVPEECCFSTVNDQFGWKQLKVDGHKACIGWEKQPEPCEKKWTADDTKDRVDVCNSLKGETGLFRHAEKNKWMGTYKDWSPGAKDMEDYCGPFKTALENPEIWTNGPFMIHYSYDGSFTNYDHKKGLFDNSDNCPQ